MKRWERKGILELIVGTKPIARLHMEQGNMGVEWKGLEQNPSEPKNHKCSKSVVREGRAQHHAISKTTRPAKRHANTNTSTKRPKRAWGGAARPRDAPRMSLPMVHSE